MYHVIQWTYYYLINSGYMLLHLVSVMTIQLTKLIC